VHSGHNTRGYAGGYRARLWRCTAPKYFLREIPEVTQRSTPRSGDKGVRLGTLKSFALPTRNVSCEAMYPRSEGSVFYWKIAYNGELWEN